jgi:hypothetical protein
VVSHVYIACMSGELLRSIGLQMHCQLLDSEADVPWVKVSVPHEICKSGELRAYYVEKRL